MCHSFVTTYKNSAIAGGGVPFLGYRYFVKPLCVSRGLARAHPRQYGRTQCSAHNFMSSGRLYSGQQ